MTIFKQVQQSQLWQCVPWWSKTVAFGVVLCKDYYPNSTIRAYI